METQGAMGLVQLENLDKRNINRKKNYDNITTELIHTVVKAQVKNPEEISFTNDQVALLKIKLEENESKNIDSLESIEKNSIDFYASIRSLYLQDRQQKILNSKKVTDTMDDSDWEEIESK